MNLSGLLESLLRTTSPAGMTEAFLWLLVCIGTLALVMKRADKAHGFTHYAPTLLTTVGILGTFAGIIVGLLDFDVSQIETSIPGLLAGLQTAFITSLAGMAASIVYKLVLSTGLLSKQKDPALDEDQIGITDLYAVMKEQAEGIGTLTASIGGDSESSLVGQFKLLRSDLVDQHKAIVRQIGPLVDNMQSVAKAASQQQTEFSQFQDRLWIKLQDFADMMSKSATEQVIQALKEVISDFNNNLTEQFGENFKQLNASVEKLVEWQENYKSQVEAMTAQYAQGVEAISQTEKSVGAISEKTATIPVAMDALKSVVEVNQHQIGELDRHLNAFADIRDRAVQAVPEIRQQIDETVDGMKQVSASISEGMGNVAQQVEKTLTDAVEHGSKQIADSSDTLKTAIVNGSEEFVANSHSVNASLQSTSDSLNKHNEETRQMMRDALDETNSVLRSLVEDMKAESKKANENLQTAGEAVIRETASIQKTFSEGLDRMTQQLHTSVEDAARQQSEAHQRVLNGLSQHADKALSDTGESVRKQVSALDEALARELNQVMTEMGRALAQISGKFTQDYARLVQEMDRVVRQNRSGAGV